MQKILNNPRLWKVLLAMIVAGLVAGGAIELPADNTTPPAPTSTPAPPRAAAGEPYASATADPRSPAPLTPLVGHEHEDLSAGAVEDTGAGQRSAPVATIKGCRTEINQHNWSQRPPGARADWIVGHWTGSRNVFGWTDVDANVSWLDRLGTKASANFIIDGEGHCAYTVPITAEAWTQAQGNARSVSIEFVSTGSEKGLTAAAIATGGLVIGQVARRLGIPLQHSLATGCAPGQRGVRDHKSFGLCGGGHPDLGTWSLAPLIAAAKAGGTTATDRVTCRKLNWWRSHGRPHGKAERNAVRRRKALTARDVTCTRSGPVLTG